MILGDSKKRKETRYSIIKRINYSTCAGCTGDVFDALAVNISSFGLCLYIYKPITVGEVILINAALPNSCQKAVVRWSRNIATDFYMVGLRCSNA